MGMINSVIKGNYSRDELDWALDHLLPSIATAKLAGCHFDRPSLIKMVAWNELVLEYSPNNKDNEGKYPRYHKAMYIIGLAAMDLHKHGYFKF